MGRTDPFRGGFTATSSGNGFPRRAIRGATENLDSSQLRIRSCTRNVHCLHNLYVSSYRLAPHHREHVVSLACWLRSGGPLGSSHLSHILSTRRHRSLDLSYSVQSREHHPRAWCIWRCGSINGWLS